MMDHNSTMAINGDPDVLIDNQPMNDEELSKLHESTLQMFRSNKIGPKNAFDIVLIDYLPAIFEGTSFEDDHMNNFQSVGTTLETSAKIYAARIDSLYSETRKTQSILCSNNDNLNRLIDEDDDDHEQSEIDDDFSQRRISNNKKVRLMVKRKKTIVNDRNKLLRKNRNEEFRPIMMNQFFLSAMHNDNLMLSDLYEKIHFTLKIDKNDQTIINESVSDLLFIDTTNSSIISNDLSPSTSEMKSSQSLISSIPIRSRTNSLSSNSSILTNAANLLTENSDEYSYLDSSKVNAFINEINNNSTPIKIDEIKESSTKLVRKRRLTIEYPFPFLVEQAKKQRLTSKKSFLQQQNQFLRPLSPEYEYSSIKDSIDSINHINDVIHPNTLLISKRQRAMDFRHLQMNMKRILFEQFQSQETPLDFSEIYSQIDENETRSNSSTNIGIYFAALLNNAVKYQLKLQSNELRDDIEIYPPK